MDRLLLEAIAGSRERLMEARRARRLSKIFRKLGLLAGGIGAGIGGGYLARGLWRRMRRAPAAPATPMSRFSNRLQQLKALLAAHPNRAKIAAATAGAAGLGGLMLLRGRRKRTE